MLIVQTGVKHPNSLDATKWRFIRDLVRSDGVIHMYVVVWPNNWYVLKDLTVSDFLKDETLYTPEINLLRDVQSCQTCGGWGKLDWITSMRGQFLGKTMPYTNPDPDDFNVDEIVYHWRLENTCFKGSTGIPTTPDYVTSLSKLGPSDKLCEMCFGCGMQLKDKNGNAVYMNSLGRWYTKTKNEDDDEY